jgi:hypothetical protein
MANFTLTYDSELKKSKWFGYPDPNYSFEGERLSWEREVVDEDGKKRTVKTYRDPIEIIAAFKPESKVYGFDKEGKIEKAAVETFGGCLKGFVWITNISGDGEVVLPCTAPHIFVALGSRLNPKLVEISSDPHAENYYAIIDSKTHVHVKGFSGVGAAAGVPPTLIAHYKMNDNLATDVIIDETGDHNGAVKDVGGTATSAFHSVVGKINLAQDFDGTDDYIEIPDDDAFTPALIPFSISAWVYIHDATNFIIASKGAFNVDGEWSLFVHADDTLRGRIFDENVEDCWIGRRTAGALTAYENSWIHLVMTYDGGTSESGIKLYINAIHSDDTSYSINGGSFVSAQNLDHAIWIGRYSSLEANGLIDTISFHKKELTIDDIKILYAGGHGTEILADLDESRRIKRRPIWQR